MSFRLAKWFVTGYIFCVKFRTGPMFTYKSDSCGLRRITLKAIQYSEDEDDNLVLGPFELLRGLEKAEIMGWVTKV
jgi:hypothetical protein